MGEFPLPISAVNLARAFGGGVGDGGEGEGDIEAEVCGEALAGEGGEAFVVVAAEDVDGFDAVGLFVEADGQLSRGSAKIIPTGALGAT